MLKTLFWEYDVSDVVRNPSSVTVLERVLELGDEEAINWLLSRVEEKDIVSYLKRRGLRKLSPKSLNYWRIFFGIN